MKKTLLIVFMVLICIAVTGCTDHEKVGKKATESQKPIPIEDNNPIDNAFNGDFDRASTSLDQLKVEDAYLEAWKTEMYNVANMIKSKYPHEKDRQCVDDYVAAYEVLQEKASALEHLNWTDTNESPDGRVYGSGTPIAGTMARADMYKQATIHLIDHYGKYQFVFREKDKEEKVQQ